MITILMICPNRTDSTSFYRAVGPFSRLKAEHKDINLSFVGEMDWAIVNMVDLVFIQRPYADHHIDAIRLARRFSKRVWVDYDDDLTEITPDNPAYDLYSSRKARENIEQAVELADVVTVSTQALARKFERSKIANVFVVPNAYDPVLMGDRISFERRNEMVVWRGSKTHERDLAVHAEAIQKVGREHPNLRWHFQGHNPWFVSEGLPEGRAQYGRALPTHVYFEELQTLKGSVMMVPLADNAFNRSKSNIAWIEGTLAGMVSVVPAWEEWEHPGCVNYDGPRGFEEALDWAVKMPKVKRSASVEASWEYIKNNLTLSKTNEIRKRILTELL